MYAGWNLVLTLIISLLCRQIDAFWPFSSVVSAESGDADTVYADPTAKRIAIIGAGAAGSSTAYYLQQYANKSGIPINITILERNSYIGGRSTTINAYGNPLEPVELGASIFVEVNTILKNSSEAFGLRPREQTEGDEKELLGIWNGKEFVFQQQDSGWYYWDIAKLLWKYGLAPIRTQRLMQSTVGKFRKLYEFPFFPFRSLSDRVFDLGLTEVTALTGEQLLKDNNIGPPFTTDIIQASTRVNYGQNLNVIHGLETMVCMAIDGAMQIEGGNWQIFAGMINSSQALTLLNTTVTSVAKKSGKYNIKTTTPSLTSSEIHTNSESFDTVVLAGPLQYSNISIGKDLLKRVPDSIPYVTLHVTLFTSPHTISGSFFNLTPGTPVPSTILTTLPVDEVPPNASHGVGSAGFWSISTLRQVINPNTLEKENLYKIFSPAPVTPDFLSSLLNTSISSDFALSDDLTWFYPHVWQSYPYEYPRVTFEDPELARGFYYTSGMESFISTMETNALMGMNVARLVVDDYLQLAEDKGAVGEEKQKIVGGDKGHLEEL
ncbi:Prenylcysteine oxidase [Mollisia scopiformis]|uniref:Prenylcysteine oxidase n=1 Tax=Mollisia scopiformis TaxID=149040 RepID=A0A194X3H8_MOLSC|nr:Prenylcysteine oxidase [Mollisia scopiformis]KUJ14755.1 Prenylcysteine oxidase [Mollisia scopiformis]